MQEQLAEFKTLLERAGIKQSPEQFAKEFIAKNPKLFKELAKK